MLNEIIKGISIALHSTFGDGYKIYTSDVEQGLKEPCFFVHILKAEQKPLIGTRSQRVNPFDILYFPVCPGNHPELYAVAEKMLFGLAFIVMPNGAMLRGTHMSYEIVDQILHFFVNYNMIVYQKKKEDKMKDLTKEIRTKKG